VNADAVRVIVVQQKQHGHAVAIRHRPIFPLVDPLVRDQVAITPPRLLIAAGKLIVDVQKVRQQRIAELTEKIGVGVAWESAAALAQGLGLMVAVGVNRTEPRSSQIKSELELTTRCIIVVMALGIHDSEAVAEPIAAGLIKTL